MTSIYPSMPPATHITLCPCRRLATYVMCLLRSALYKKKTSHRWLNLVILYYLRSSTNLYSNGWVFHKRKHFSRIWLRQGAEEMIYITQLVTKLRGTHSHSLTSYAGVLAVYTHTSRFLKLQMVRCDMRCPPLPSRQGYSPRWCMLCISPEVQRVVPQDLTAQVCRYPT